MGEGRNGALFRWYVAGVALLAVVPVGLAARSLTVPSVRDAAVPGALFLLLHILARRFPIRLLGRELDADVMTATAFGYAVLLTTPLPVGVVALTAVAAVPLRPSSFGPMRLPHRVLEVARAALVFGAAGAVLHAIVPAEHLGGAEPTLVMLGALALGGVTGYVVDVGIGTLGTAITQGVPAGTVLRQDRASLDLPTHLLQVGLAPVVVLVTEHSILLLPLLVLAVIALYRSHRAAAERRHESLHDSLTGLPNRRMLDLRLETLVADGRQRSGFAVLLMDLDRFKEVNDRLGHQMGDHLLAQVGARLGQLEGVDLAARLGGDEFAFIVRRADGDSDLLAAGERLVAEVSRPYVVQDVRLSIGASIGIATYPDHGLDTTTLLRRADSAMYSAKRSGVAVGLATVRNETGIPGRMSLLGELEDALRRDELRLDYQPQVSLRTGEIVGVESLLRWHHPQHGLVPPGVFVETVEHTELIAALTRHVVDQALTDLSRWVVAGVTVPVAINISARDLQDRRLPSDLSDLLDRHAVMPGQVTLEITENALLGEAERAYAVLGELKELGVTLSIDDFGTGYSSLAALRDLPVQEVKIDRSFVAAMEEDATGAAIVRSIVQLAHALGLRVVAEGVEDETTLIELEAYGCAVVQGYLISRPLPSHLVAPWVRARRRELADHRAVNGEGLGFDLSVLVRTEPA